MVLNENRQVVFGNRTLTEFARSQGVGSFIGMRPGEILACRVALDAENGCGTGEECRHCGAVESVLAALKGHKASHECRVLRTTPRGIEALDLKVWGTPLRWHGEDFALLVAVDISNEKRRKVLERLFFHDVLNTAGTITLMTEMLMKGTLPFDEVKGDLWETAQTLVNEIRGQRELLAAENDELKVRFSLLEARTILDAVCTIYRHNEAGKEKRIDIDDETDGLQFVSDPALLTRVVGNLLKNALEASGPGRTVAVACRHDGYEVLFSCHNEGVIPRDVQLQIFQRSFSTKGVGRGIGTYSVKLLAEKFLQGRVWFVSTPSEGTTFVAAFPIHPDLGI
jgi:signal transduction histidine kinase